MQFGVSISSESKSPMAIALEKAKASEEALRPAVEAAGVVISPSREREVIGGEGGIRTHGTLRYA